MVSLAAPRAERDVQCAGLVQRYVDLLDRGLESAALHRDSVGAHWQVFETIVAGAPGACVLVTPVSIFVASTVAFETTAEKNQLQCPPGCR